MKKVINLQFPTILIVVLMCTSYLMHAQVKPSKENYEEKKQLIYLPWSEGAGFKILGVNENSGGRQLKELTLPRSNGDEKLTEPEHFQIRSEMLQEEELRSRNSFPRKYETDRLKSVSHISDKNGRFTGFDSFDLKVNSAPKNAAFPALQSRDENVQFPQLAPNRDEARAKYREEALAKIREQVKSEIKAGSAPQISTFSMLQSPDVNVQFQQLYREEARAKNREEALAQINEQVKSEIRAVQDELLETYTNKFQPDLSLKSATAVTAVNESDSLALVALYNATNGSGWTNNSNWLAGPISTWYGVTVSSDRVVELNLSGSWDIPFGLTGSLPSEIGNLTALAFLNLSFNRLTGNIPVELGSLTNLQSLSLTDNQLTGSIPAELSNLINLQFLGLDYNQLTGTIPVELGNLSNLRYFYLSGNQLTGSIPPELGQLSNLIYLAFSRNSLTGTIPVELSNLINLQSLYLSGNQLTGTIPAELATFSNLYRLSLSGNQLIGSIPAELGQLSSLISLDLTWNQLTGAIPAELGNLLNLQYIYLGGNQLTGSLPVELGNLLNLQYIYLGRNQLTGSLPVELGNCSSLRRLYIEYNDLSGLIPAALCNLPLEYVNFQDNLFDEQNCPTILCLLDNGVYFAGDSKQSQQSGFQLVGECRIYPPVSVQDSLALVALYNATNGPGWINNDNWLQGPVGTWFGIIVEDTIVTRIELWNNQLSGTIPPEIGQLSNMRSLYLSDNQLAGNIPPELGQLTNVYNLELGWNQLTGSIPLEISMLANLQSLYLSGNQLTGTIPPGIGQLSNLRSLYLSDNQLTGNIPAELGQLSNLYDLDLGWNLLSGNIPIELGQLSSLYYLQLGWNQLTGSIPPELGQLLNLNSLYLESNQLSGALPIEMANCTNLRDFFLGYNNLSGTIPTALCNLPLSYINFQGNLFDDQSCPTIQCLLDKGVYFAGDPKQPQQSGFQLVGECRVYPPVSIQDSLALVALYNATNGPGWTNNDNWLQGPVGTWHGITVEDTSVVSVELWNNNLTGTIPPETGQLKNLRSLYLQDNQLSGAIPSELGQLSSLNYLVLSWNQLSGSIPIELGQLTNLYSLELTYNQLTGSLPVELGNLSNLQNMYLHGNKLTGSVPAEFGNCSNLRGLYIGFNNLSGVIPNTLCNLPLYSVYFEGNLFDDQSCPTIQCLLDNGVYFDGDPKQPQQSGFQLVGECKIYPPVSVQDSLALVALYNATNGPGWINNDNWLTGPVGTWYGVTVNEDRVVELNLSGSWNNPFGLEGSLPSEIGNLNALEMLILSYNNISGAIPVEIGNLTSLRELGFVRCRLDGSIPQEIGNLINLQYLSLYDNQLTGEIPASIGNLQQLWLLELAYNSLTGNIPVEIYGLTNLGYLFLAGNQLDGTIHSNISQLHYLQRLNLSSNYFSGTIPAEISQLSNLRYLQLNSNQLSGSIPVELGNLIYLRDLYLSRNQLTGSIPVELFQSLQSLDISINQLDHLPDISNTPNLYRLNLNYNNFTFEDLEYNMDIPMVQSPWGESPNFDYIPQNRTGIADTIVLLPGDNYTLDITCGGTQNIYQWYKNNYPVDTPSVNSSMKIMAADYHDAGIYYCRITNSLVPNLAILSEPIFVKLDYPKNDIIRSLVITEARMDTQTDTYLELTNMGDTAINLNQFKLGTMRPWSNPVYDVWNDPWVPEYNRYFMLPGYLLQAGESYVITAAYDFGPEQYKNKTPGFEDFERVKQTEIYNSADFLIHVQEPRGDNTDSVTWDMVYKDNYQWVMDVWHGRDCYYLEQKLSPVDSVVIDQVGGVFDVNGRNNSTGFYDVAGVAGATGNSILVRKYSVKTGNPDFANARGMGLEDSEWIPIPLPGGKYRDVYHTVDNHGSYDLGTSSFVSDEIIVDISNLIITVPWGTRRGDGIMRKMETVPGIAWKYHLSPVSEDSLTHAARTGDQITVYVAGNDMDTAIFNIIVMEPAADANIVVPVSSKDADGLWRGDNEQGILDWPRVTEHETGQDTITGIWYGIPYATRADSLLKRLEKSSNATWEVVWVDGVERTVIKDGDKLRVTAENGTIKDYYIQVQPPQPSHNAYLSSITWPDIPDFYRGIFGWKGDTIPNFNPTVYNYRISVPYDVTGIPAIGAKASDLNATVQVNRATNLSGTIEQRTYQFIVTAEDDYTINVYSIELVKEKSPENVQPFYAEPFLSEFIFWDQWSNSFGEIANPGNQPLDLSNYMIAMDWINNPADMIISGTAPEEWLDRYDKYVPGYKWVGESQWVISPGILEQDLNVNPIVQPGDVFCMGAIFSDEYTAPSWLPDYIWPVPAQLDVQFNNYNGIKTYQNPWGEPVSGNGTPVRKWMNSNWYMFKILNDSIKLGLKPANDPNDFELIEYWGMGDGTNWIIGGLQANMITNWMRKPSVWKGRTEAGSAGSFGTNPDDCEWTWTNHGYWQARNTGWPLEILNIGNDIGQHFMNEPTHYISSVTSVVYKVSEGFSWNENIRGVITGATAAGFLENIIKADDGQSLLIRSSLNGADLTGAAILSNGDSLIVTSADSSNVTKYVLEVTDQGLNSDAILTSAVYDVFVDGVTGTISGFDMNTTVRTIFNAMNVPEGAIIAVVDSENNPVPFRILNYNDEYSEVLANHGIYFKVVAEDGITTISYQLVPSYDETDVFVFSNLFQVDQNLVEVQNIPLGIAVTTLLDNLFPSAGAILHVEDKMGIVLTGGELVKDDRVVVTDGSITKTYSLFMLGYPVSDCPRHFYTVWEGTSGVDHMNIYCIGAKLNGVDLEAGDEIGIFDGEFCVGYGKVELTIDNMHILGMVISRNDGSGSGYTAGNNISYKIWDCSSSTEWSVQTANYYDNQLNPVSPPTFEAGATAYVELFGSSIICITPQFKEGWNIFSVNNFADPGDIKALFQPLIDNGSLIKIQDEQGNSLENLGIFGGWANNIGNISPAEGYKIKVNFNDSLSTCGMPVDFPYTIPLSTGWNIAGYPHQTEVDGMAIVQQLIDRGSLVKVQDEAGNSIENLGIFGGWQNNIGNFVPGEGYKLKVSFDDVLLIEESYPKSSVILPEAFATVHYKPVHKGNGVDHMNINLVELPDKLLQKGDELAVFDGDLCVGAISLLDHHLENQSVSIAASADDGQGMQGFSDGNFFNLKLWKASLNKEFELSPEFIAGSDRFIKHESSLISLGKYEATGLEGLFGAGTSVVRCYPNPFSDQVTIEIELAEHTDVKVEVLNQIGQSVRIINQKKLLPAGTHRLNWDGLNQSSGQVAPGIYYVKIDIGELITHQKIVLYK